MTSFALVTPSRAVRASAMAFRSSGVNGSDLLFALLPPEPAAGFADFPADEAVFFVAMFLPAPVAMARRGMTNDGCFRRLYVSGSP